MEVTVTVNGECMSATVEPRLLLSDFIRHELGLTGTHVGCEHGVCGACTVIVDGVAVRACLMLAVQVTGRDVRTIEGVAGKEGGLSEVQHALGEELGLQCGFCTPGFVMSMTAALEQAGLDEESLTEVLGGHLCRCTGYQGIRRAGEALLHRRAEPQP
jgi:aerobic-type carbon monoxide dehydrogenase small subunit (CoxS/CutS family)